MNSDLLFYITLLFTVSGALERTKLINNNTYRLLSQHDGRYLTEGPNGLPTKSQGSGQNANFKFINSNERNNIWVLEGLSSGQPLAGTSWQVSYVGHGKYQFKNVQTGMCLQGTGSEGVCGKDNPIQRWFVEVSTN